MGSVFVYYKSGTHVMSLGNVSKSQSNWKSSKKQSAKIPTDILNIALHQNHLASVFKLQVFTPTADSTAVYGGALYSAIARSTSGYLYAFYYPTTICLNSPRFLFWSFRPSMAISYPRRATCIQLLGKWLSEVGWARSSWHCVLQAREHQGWVTISLL